VVDEQGKVHLVRCKVCSKINGKDKIFSLKSLQKHARRRKALMAVPKICGVGEYYMNKYSIHAKNETWLYVIAKKDLVVKQIYHDVVGEREKIGVVFYLFPHVG
jgi:hypothetical protein